MTKIFVGYGYNVRDQWIEDLVLPLIRSFGFDVETGKDGHGQDLSPLVKDRIKGSHAAIGFATRRDQLQNDTWTTHRWVTDELAFAAGRQLPLVEIREDGLDPQLGVQHGRVYMQFTDATRESFLLKDFVPLLNRWRRELSRIRLQLLPETIGPKIIPVYRQPGFKCVYRVMHEAEERDPLETKILPISGGLFVDVGGVPDGASVQVEISHDGHTLSSRFESVEYPSVMLQGNWP